MWTTIQAGARSALTDCAVLFVMAGVLVSSGCDVPSLPLFSSPHVYLSHQWVLLVTPAPPWHPDESLSLHWKPIRSETAAKPPRTMSCHFALYGPFPTVSDAAMHVTAIGDQPAPDAPLADSSPSFTLPTDPAAPAPAPFAHTLPAALAPGYYAVEGSVDAGDTFGGCGGVTFGEVVT